MKKNLDMSFDPHHLEAVQRDIKKNGVAYVTVVPIVGTTEHGHHYTVGLTNQGFPEIFLSGRLPNDVAYAIMQKLVKNWKNRGFIKTGLYNGFIDLNGGYKADAILYHADATEAMQKNPDFLALMEAALPGASKNLVQILWPDTKGRLPNNPAYEKHIDFYQMQLPEKVEVETKEAVLPPVIRVPPAMFDFSSAMSFLEGVLGADIGTTYAFKEAARRAGFKEDEHDFSGAFDVKDNILSISFDYTEETVTGTQYFEDGKATFEIDRETKQVMKMTSFKGPKKAE